MANEEGEFADRRPDAPFGARGRGAAINPANRLEGSDPKRGVIRRLELIGDHLDAEYRDGAVDPARKSQVPTEIIPDRSRSILSWVDSPDIPFRWSLNPYRGCEHGCIYCYARPSHEYLGFSCGLDFETKIVAKNDAATLLKRKLATPSWAGETIALSGVTDPYQPIEQDLQITRQCLEVMVESRQPVGIVTKGRMVLRDIDLLQQLVKWNAVRVAITITTLDHQLASKLEPRASSPRDRLETIRVLSEAGIPVAAMVAPVIPGLTDREIPELLRAISEAGAARADYIMLRLPFELKSLFLDWLRRHVPERAGHIEALIRSTRGGELYDARPGIRMRGTGPIAEQIGSLFGTLRSRYSLDRDVPPLSREAFIKPPAKRPRFRTRGESPHGLFDGV